MSKEGSLVPIEAEERIALLQAATDGKLDSLPCPRCGQPNVSVWFTRRTENDFWTWFLCSSCSFEMRAQGTKPEHYSKERELTGYNAKSQD